MCSHTSGPVDLIGSAAALPFARRLGFQPRALDQGLGTWGNEPPDIALRHGMKMPVGHERASRARSTVPPAPWLPYEDCVLHEAVARPAIRSISSSAAATYTPDHNERGRNQRNGSRPPVLLHVVLVESVSAFGAKLGQMGLVLGHPAALVAAIARLGL